MVHVKKHKRFLGIAPKFNIGESVLVLGLQKKRIIVAVSYDYKENKTVPEIIYKVELEGHHSKWLPESYLHRR